MKNKAIWVGTYIGLIFAVIPSLVVLTSDPNGEGAYFLFSIPPFFLAGGTLHFLVIKIVSLFYSLFGISQQAYSFKLVSHVINVILWALIGALIGMYINKRKRGKNEK